MPQDMIYIIWRMAVPFLLVAGCVSYGICLLFGKGAWVLYTSRAVQPKSPYVMRNKKLWSAYARKTRVGLFVIDLGFCILFIHLPFYFGAGMVWVRYAGSILGVIFLIRTCINAVHAAGLADHSLPSRISKKQNETGTKIV
jgi:hypothetical protein